MRRIHYLKVFVEGKYQIAFLLDKIRIFASFYPDKQGTERKVYKLITSHKDQVQAKTNKKKEDEKMKAKGVRVLVARSKKENKKRIRTPRLDACLIFIGPNFFHTMTSHFVTVAAFSVSPHLWTICSVAHSLTRSQYSVVDMPFCPLFSKTTNSTKGVPKQEGDEQHTIIMLLVAAELKNRFLICRILTG